MGMNFFTTSFHRQCRGETVPRHAWHPDCASTFLFEFSEGVSFI